MSLKEGRRASCSLTLHKRSVLLGGFSVYMYFYHLKVCLLQMRLLLVM